MSNIMEPMVLEEDDVKIRVFYATIGPEDLWMYREGDFYSREGVLGYEMAGEIVDLGDYAKREGYSVGDRVSGIPVIFCKACYFCKTKRFNYCESMVSSGGCICEYIVWKSNQLVKLPDNVSYKEGCLIGSIAEGLEAIGRTAMGLGSTVLIWGSEYKGIIMTKLAHQCGAKKIALVANNKYGKEAAYNQGANYVLEFEDPELIVKLLKYTDYNGFEYSFDTTGIVDTISKTIDTLTRGGTLVIMTQYKIGKQILFDASNIFLRNYSIIGSYLSNLKLEDAAKIIHSLDLSSLITSELTFEHAQKAYEVMKKDSHFKVGIKIA